MKIKDLSERGYQAVGWRWRKLDGYGVMTCAQFYVLQEMINAKKDDWVFVDLGAIHPGTVKTLKDQGYIFASHGPDGVRYSITSLGERAHRVFSLPREQRRSDGKCPRCERRQRSVSKSGVMQAYCKPCLRDIARKQNQLKMYSLNPGICPKCNKRSKAISKSGKVYQYCRQCRNEGMRKYRQQLSDRQTL